MHCFERHQSLVESLPCFHFLIRGGILCIDFLCLFGYSCGNILLVVVFLCIFPPGTEMIFVENYAVPMHLLYPFVGGFYASHTICSKNILKRCEANKPLRQIHMIKLPVLLFFHEGPSLEVLVC